MTEPTSGDPTTMSSMSMTGETETDAETEATTEPTTSGPTGCQSSDECMDPAAPICDDEVCVGCNAVGDGDVACGDRDPGTPACAEDGSCVQCTDENTGACGDTTPFCDAATSTCVPCTYHEQCPSGACRIALGSCFDPLDVHQVGDGQTYVTITEAVETIGENLEVVLVLHGGPDFNEAVTLSGDGTAYAFLSADEQPPQWVRTSGMGPTLSVEDGAEVYVHNVRFTGNLFTGAAAVSADDARVYFDRAAVVANQGGGIALTNGAYAQVRNCFVGGAAGARPAIGADGGTLEVSYSTLGGNGINAVALTCDGATVSVRNSILVAEDDAPEIACDATITYSATESGVAGPGNVAVSDMEYGWFEGYIGGNFSLTGPGAGVFADIAQWNTGDPSVDIDGDLRPNVDGAADVAGADVP
jgi:hypothetical protein